MSDPADNTPKLPESDEPETNNNSQSVDDETGSVDGTATSGASRGQDDGNDADSDPAEDIPAPSGTPGTRKRAAETDAGDSSKKAKATPPTSTPTPRMEILNCSLSAPAGSTGGGIIIANCPISNCSISGAQISGCGVNNCSVSRSQVSNGSINCCSVSGEQVTNCTISCSSVAASQLINCTSSLSSISGNCRQTNNSGVNSTNFGTSSLFMINGHSFRGSTGRFNGFQNSAIRTGRMVIPSREPLNVQIQRNTIGNDLQVVLGPTTVTITPRAGISPKDFAVYRNDLGQMEIDWETPGRHERVRTQVNNTSRNAQGATGGSAACWINGHSIEVRTSGSNGASIAGCGNGRVTIPSSEPLNTPIQITTNGNILTAVLGGINVTVTPRAGTSPNDLVVYRNNRGEIEVELP